MYCVPCNLPRCLMLGPNRVIAKKFYPLLLCQMRDINSTNRGECLVPNKVRLITMHSQDLQTNVVQLKGWLSDWSLVVVRMAIELKYCNIPYIYSDTYLFYIRILRLVARLKGKYLLYSLLHTKVFLNLTHLPPTKTKHNFFIGMKSFISKINILSFHQLMSYF